MCDKLLLKHENRMWVLATHFLGTLYSCSRLVFAFCKLCFNKRPNWKSQALSFKYLLHFPFYLRYHPWDSATTCYSHFGDTVLMATMQILADATIKLSFLIWRWDLRWCGNEVHALAAFQDWSLQCTGQDFVDWAKTQIFQDALQLPAIDCGGRYVLKYLRLPGLCCWEQVWTQMWWELLTAACLFYLNAHFSGMFQRD